MKRPSWTPESKQIYGNNGVGGSGRHTSTPSPPTTRRGTASHRGVNVAGCDIYRQNADGQTWRRVNDQPISGTSYVDVGLNEGTNYSYYVTAVSDQQSQSPPTSQRSATTADGPPTVQIVSPLAYTGVSVDWADAGSVTKDGRITKLTPVNIIVADAPSAAVSWSLTLQPLGADGTPEANSATITLASGTGQVGVGLDSSGAPVFALDPALYPSGDYALVLTASNGVGDDHTATVSTTISLFSPAKLGGLTLPVTDLTVPVPGGQPITITRVYDSQQANVKGDFGYGWSLQATASALRTVTEPPSGGYAGTTAFRPGDLVYITIPGGGQHVFQFWPVPNSYQPGHDGNPYDPLTYQLLDNYAAQFVCVDGSGSTLTVPGDIHEGIETRALLTLESTRELIDSETNQLFNPATYTLTTADGTSYVVDGGSGRITRATSPNGQVTDYSDTSKINSGGVSVKVNRTDGLITSVQVEDRNGNVIGQPIAYIYDEHQDLIAVQARDGATTNYAYSTEAALAHHLVTVTDPRGVPVLKATYNTLGELSGLTDAQNNPATVNTGGDDGSGDSQTVSDLTSQQNTTQDIQDSQGNVIRQIKSITNADGTVSYQVTLHQYAYFTGDLSAEINNVFPFEGSTTPGISNQNTISSQIDYQPFVVSSLQAALNDQPNDPTNPASATSIARQVDFGGAGDAAHPGAQGLPVREVDALAGGATRVTTDDDYKLGKPQRTTVKVFAAGVSPDTGSAAQTSVTRSFVDDNGNVVLCFDALGQGTEYEYDPSNPSQLIKTWQVANWSTVADTFNVNDPNTWPAKLTSQPQSQNVYYAAGDNSPGAYTGQVKYSVDAAGQQTWLAYDALGNQVLAYKLWINPVAGQSNLWVGTTTTFDADGRPLTTTNNTYIAIANTDGSYSLPVTLDSGGNPAVNATLYSLNGVRDTVPASGTAYTAVGQTDITTDQYGKQTRNLYDIKNNVVQTATGVTGRFKTSQSWALQNQPVSWYPFV
jgi:hypothetical protein